MIAHTFRHAWAFIAGVIVLLGYLMLFPGRQAFIAFTLATGVGVSSLQRQVDSIEEKAIAKVPLDEDEVDFLKALYTSMVTGARLTIVLRQSADMMERYLSCTGEDLKTDLRIFRDNRKVQDVADSLRRAILADVSRGTVQKQYTSETFYMPDESSPDSIFGLYYGKVLAFPAASTDDSILVRWRAEVPWEWPSYEDLQRKYGDPHAESFPLPNLLVALLGSQYALYVDNGLGEYLTRIGLARSFLVYAEWEEVYSPSLPPH